MEVLLAIFVVVLAIYLVNFARITPSKKHKKICRVVRIKKLCHAAVLHQGGDQDNISFSTKDATTSTYSSFIEALRARLTNGAPTECGIPVLPQSSSVPDSRRFVLVDLSNSDGNTVTVAIDVENVYVKAFRVGDQVRFFNDAPEAAIKTSFTKTVKPPLPKKPPVNFRPVGCTCNYRDLENRKDTQPRKETNLGISALDKAIKELWGNVDAADGSSLLVIIQMVSEAVRFRYIEKQVRGSIIRRNSSEADTLEADNFKPDPFMLSLENNWSKISKAIQSRNGIVFQDSVILDCPKNKDVITVANIQSPVIFDLVLLLHAGRQREDRPRGKPRKPSILGNPPGRGNQKKKFSS
ncbi:ribosome-inactivating protein cucurmosin-like [Rhododendron vialii]|uniref:ribosome-inactivating protein cucurmosin-like n=1 Tax=Rhododendron vialii TaxID=182163 RepID=UPI00265E1191|nr:ribosome-inactivating protein cucurmosin-like [Rhododendron vialii]